MSFASWSLACLDMQGYRLTAQEKRALLLPIKLAPGLCATLTLLFVALQSAAGLFALAGIALAGTVLPRAVFDYVYGWLLSRPLGTGWAPRNAPQRRFACGMAAVLLGAAGLSMASGATLLGSAIALVVVATASVVTVTNWCLPSFVYNLLPGMPGRVPSRARRAPRARDARA